MTVIADVESGAWAATLASLASDGYRLLDVLTAVDRGDTLEVVARVVATDPLASTTVRTSVAAVLPRLASITGSHPAAAWHEREVAEQFGLDFDGHPDPRPLLHRLAPAQPPLRKSTPLIERVATPWPAAADAGADRRPRRPQLPPGVRPEWVTGP